jgi:hypothetical protein
MSSENNNTESIASKEAHNAAKLAWAGLTSVFVGAGLSFVPAVPGEVPAALVAGGFSLNAGVKVGYDAGKADSSQDS